MCIRDSLVTRPDAPPKGDAADFAGQDAEILELINSARPYPTADLIDELEGVLGRETDKKQSQATRLLKLADAAHVDLFHDGDDGYATIRSRGHLETFRLNSQAAKLWLRHLYYSDDATAPTAQAITDALAVLSARARFDGDQRTVWLRTASHDGNIYVDLGDPSWRAVEVTPSGTYRVVDIPPVRFRRANGMYALPVPVGGGDLMELARFVNVPDEDECRMCLSWLIGSL
jgi:hypothetical protein